MQEQRADSLQLAVGKPASLVQNGSIRPITRDPLNDAQIQGLVREIATAETATQLGFADVSFSYRSPFGEIQVELKPGANGTAVLRPATPATTAAAAPPPPKAAPAGPRAPASPSPSSSQPIPVARPAADTAGLRAAMEDLFRQLVQ